MLIQVLVAIRLQMRGRCLFERVPPLSEWSFRPLGFIQMATLDMQVVTFVWVLEMLKEKDDWVIKGPEQYRYGHGGGKEGGSCQRARFINGCVMDECMNKHSVIIWWTQRVYRHPAQVYKLSHYGLACTGLVGAHGRKGGKDHVTLRTLSKVKWVSE